MVTKERIGWVDTLRGLGIIAIYVGHFGSHAGPLHSFVYAYHVPLFFFISGFFVKIKSGENLFQSIKKLFLHIMVPYIGFLAIAAIVYHLHSGYNVPWMIGQGFFGIRNRLFAGSLWFLPCLFVMAVLYQIILRIVKKKVFALLVAIILFVVSRTILPFNPGTQPSWFWNIDSALYYIIYYAFGAFIFTYIKDIKYKSTNRTQKAIIALFALICFAVTAVVFFKGAGYIPSLVNISITPIKWLMGIMIVLFLIFANIFLAVFLNKVTFLQNLGKSTLILCGTENMLKILVPSFVSIFSLSINLSDATALKTLIYAIFLLTVNYYTVTAFIKKYMPLLAGQYTPKAIINKDK